MSYDMTKYNYEEWDFRKKVIKERKKLLFKLRSKRKFVEQLYREQMGIEADLDNPKTFTEKINAFKLIKDRRFSDCADKDKVRKYVKEKIGEEYLIPQLFSKRKIKEKDLRDLPKGFVLKTNNGSGTNYIVKNKDDEDLVKLCEYLNYLTKIKFQYLWGEFHYAKIKPRIVCEELLQDKKGNIPDDLKCFCFKDDKGKRRKILYIERVVGDERYRIMFDENWEPININSSFAKLDIKLKKPKNYKEILHVIDKLSEDFNFVRVDLFILGSKVYFGELTFTPTAGYLKFEDDKTDLLWGSYIGNK